MSKTKAGITAGAVLLSAALAVILLNSWLTTQSFDGATEGANSSHAPTTTASQSDQVWTYNCEMPVQRPEEILLTSADGGWMLNTITWSKWGIGGAEGMGIFREKLCEPSCAEGEIAEEKVMVRLSNLAERGGVFNLKT